MSIKDAVFAVCAILVGAAGLWVTLGYVPQARHFPQAMFAIILVSGLVILVQAVRPSRAASSPGQVAVQRVPAAGPGTPVSDDAAHIRGGFFRGALPFAMVLIAWALALSFGAGYLLPGFIAGAGLMFIAGASSPARIVVGSAAVVLFCFVMFYIVFHTRIPETTMVREFFAPLRNLI